MAKNRKLGRTSSQRKAVLRDLATDLIINERITTTFGKAKEAARFAEKLVTLGKRGDLHARRQAAKLVRNELATVSETEDEIIVESVLQKLFGDLAERFENREGGYTRVIKAEPRRGDGAPMGIVEFVGELTESFEEETVTEETEASETEETNEAAEEVEEVAEEETEETTEEETGEA